MRKLFSILLLLFISINSWAKYDTLPVFHTIEKRINYSEKRKRLSVEYLQKRHGLEINTPIIKPKIIVLHFTEGGTIKSVFNYLTFSFEVCFHLRLFSSKMIQTVISNQILFICQTKNTYFIHSKYNCVVDLDGNPAIWQYGIVEKLACVWPLN